MFKEKADKMESFVENFLTDKQSLEEKVMSAQLEVRRSQADWILQLHDHVFPVEHVEAEDWPQEADNSDRMMMECLADAMRTSYISGRWVNSDYRDSGDHYRIVPTPTSSERSSTGQDLTQHNIAAAHTLAAQFVSLAAGVLRLPLPVKLCWADLGVIETSEAKLARKVSKLNINMIRLCLECGVDVRAIRPTQCLHNLFSLIQTLRNYNTVPLTSLNTGDMLDTLQSQLDEETNIVCDEADSDSDEDCDEGWRGGAPGGEAVSGWESVTSDQVSAPESSPPSMPSQSSIASSVSQFLWGYSNTPQNSPHTNKK